jgi:hypothetical protein
MPFSNADKTCGSTDSRDTAMRQKCGGSPFKSLLRHAARPVVRLHRFRDLRERALRQALCRQAVARPDTCKLREPR